MTEKTPVSIEDLAAWPMVHDLRLTPDGSRLVWLRSQASLEKNRYLTNLWTMRADGTDVRQLTAGGSDGPFACLQDGSIVFSRAPKAADGEAAGRLMTIRPDGGEALPLVDLPFKVEGLAAAADGTLVICGIAPRPDESDFVVAEEVPVWFNGKNYVTGDRHGVWAVRGAGSGAQTVTKLSADDEDVSVARITPTGDAIVLVSQRNEGVAPETSSVWLVSLADGSRTQLLDDRFEVRDAVPADGLVYLLATDMRAHGHNEDSFVYTVAYDGSGFRRVSKDDFDLDCSPVVGSDMRHGHGQLSFAQGEDLLFVATDRERSPLVRITATGELTRPVDADGCVECADVAADGTLYYVAMRGNDLPEIFRLAPGGAEERLTNVSAVLAERTLVTPEPLSVGAGADEVAGYVMPPVGYDPMAAPGTYPGVLWIHGGPKTELGDVLFHEMQYLAGLGYFVFFCNPHGSGGRGVEFSDIRCHYGERDYDDLMAFTDAVLERYPALDAHRLAVEGGSYGGFMTNWIIGHTDRFACACSQRSISNWTSKMGVTDIGYFFVPDQHLTPEQLTAWDDDAFLALWRVSPVAYANRCTTPTLLLHSEEDRRCSLDQGMQMFTALKQHGCEARLVIFKGENHELSRGGRPRSRVRRLEEIRDWYAKYLQK